MGRKIEKKEEGGEGRRGERERERQRISNAHRMEGHQVYAT
jgi:hypothetical protein